MTDSLHYHLSDPECRKPIVLLIHGLFGSLDNLAAIRRGLEAEYTVLSIDLPDHGRSQPTSNFSFDEYVQRVVELLHHLDIEQTHIVGHSLGGKVAMALSLSTPEKVNKLVVADIAPVAYAPRHQAVLAGLRNVDLKATRDRKHAEEQLAMHIVEPGVRQFLLKSLYQQSEGWAWRFNLDLLERDYPKLSESIDNGAQFVGSVLFVKGGESDYLQAEHRPVISRLFPNSQAKIIQGAGHWLHAEKPAVFNRVVSRFLSQ